MLETFHIQWLFFSNLLTEQPLIFAIVYGIFGLLVGSFLNVVIYRFPLMMQRQWYQECCDYLGLEPEGPPTPTLNLVYPRSRCPVCQHPITALENIPVISYLFLQGKCRQCRTKISWRYPLIELLTGILTFITAWQLGFGWPAFWAVILTWVLISLSFIDLDTMYLPDDIVLPTLWLGLLLSVFNIYIDVVSSVLGAIAGYLSLWLVYQVFKLLTGKEGMGYGDFKLLALLGAWIGWQSLPTIILLSSLLGSVVGISLMLFQNHGRNTPIPFGPYLAGAGWLTLLWGEPINTFYVTWIGLN